ncbi:MAG: UDP-N-acetylmuramoyl-L-alanyl-D-glutamate--2,6-diaminopimelate ligase [Thermodesulfobacteriota bacterium]|nr:UDP-N-acetylmuramoyl-L-alanyl-D-glutamate--2,6-diaminopimelate ligase [Thermodesulfobacteriota bacterium]
MKLSSLLKTVTPVSFYGTGPDAGQFSLSPDPEISSIHYRAQDVKPGGLFVAIKGFAADGHDFIDEALARGASAIVTQKPVIKKSIIIEVKNTRNALGAISDRFYSNPSKKLFLIGITGTNGKTTTAFFVENLLSEAGIKVGVIGTLNYRYSGKTFQNPMTTPESYDLQKILAEMLKSGITHVVMEVSSHAIDLDRICNCRFNLLVFTNLTQDHLDYHGDMNSYWSCKKKFFTQITDHGSANHGILAVINHNDEKGRELIKLLEASIGKPSVLSAGFSNGNSIWAKDITHDLTGISGKVITPDGAFEFKSPLVGKHNLENILCATGVGIVLNLSLDSIKTGIQTVCAVPGRLESIPNDINRFIYVDYAHTPDALENVLSALKFSATGRIICVFGCGGNRDKTKRPLMGRAAARLCDLTVITSDNPRTEPPMEIIEQIVQGTQKTISNAYTPADLSTGFRKKGYVVEPDRKTAIQLAITASRSGDIVLIAGKGNETYQIIGNNTIRFDDRNEARTALSKLEIQGSKHNSYDHPKPGARNPGPQVRPTTWTTAEILEATGGDLLLNNLKHSFSGISIDSRNISVDELFVAIKGDTHDGHSFIGDVIERGVSGLLIDRANTHTLPGKESIENGIVCITVNDTIRALGDLAAFNRKRSNASVVAITGSNGKTSTRKMTAGVVSKRFSTLSTSGNLNNQIGLPLTLLNLNLNHRWAVLELAMNSPGEIKRLTEICSPDIGVITNIGPAHLEGLGSLDAVMQAKGELLEEIKPDGTAVLNADDPRLLQLADYTSKNVLFFGRSKNARIRARSVKGTETGLSFTLVLPEENITVDLKTPAAFMISNALAAAAVGYLLGLTAGEIKDGLEDFKPVKGRMNILKTGKGINIIDDTYNANPDSMKAAINTLRSLKGNHTGILVAGDMLELGNHAESMHRNIGRIAAGSDIAKLYVTGQFSQTVASGAMDEDMNPRDIFTGTKEEILEGIKDRLGPDDWVLVKGSRGMTMETIVQGLLDWAND